MRRRIALLLCGHLRTWSKCLPSFREFVHDVDHDVFIHTYTTVKGYHPYIRDTHGITDNMRTESEVAVRSRIGIPYARLVIEAEAEAATDVKAVEQKDLDCYQWPQYGDYDDLQVLKGKGISIRTYLQYRKFRLCNELRKEYEKATGTKYECVIKARMDLDYSRVSASLVSLLGQVSVGKILTSSANNQPNDHIYVGSSDDIDRLLIGMATATLPTNREYGPHEYLARSLLTAELRWEACIHNLGVIRS